MTLAQEHPVITRAGVHLADAISAVAIVGTVLGWLPLVAAFAGFIWYCIQIWESRTVQHWYENRRMVRKARKIARLKAKEKVIVAQLEALETLRQARVEARDKVELAKVEAAKLATHEQIDAESKR